MSDVPPGDRAQVRGVFDRVRRDRQVSNLLYGLLGWEDERDPEAAIESLAVSARQILETAGPAYRIRVVCACQLLTAMVLDAAESVVPGSEVPERPDPREIDGG